MEPLITLPALLADDTSNWDELNEFPTVVNAVVVPCRTSGCPLPTKTFRAPLLSVVVGLEAGEDAICEAGCGFCLGGDVYEHVGRVCECLEVPAAGGASVDVFECCGSFAWRSVRSN